MRRGYTKSWRKELESDIWKMPPLYHRVWFYIRQRANWETKLMPTNIIPKIGMWVSPGMLITSLSQIAESISYFSQGGINVPDRKTIQRILQWLEQYGMIMLDCHTRGTIIYVLNWDVYQSKDDSMSHEMDNGLDNGLDTTKESKRIKQRIKKERKNRADGNDLFLEEPKLKVNEFIAKYVESFKALYGDDPIITQKEAGICTRLIKIPKIETIMERFFESNDDFIIKNVHSLNIVESQANKLLNQKSKKSGIDVWLEKKGGMDEQRAG